MSLMFGRAMSFNIVLFPSKYDLLKQMQHLLNSLDGSSCNTSLALVIAGMMQLCINQAIGGLLPLASILGGLLGGGH